MLDYGHWENQTGIDFIPRLDDYLGFIYRISNKTTGEYYIGRKQFWNKRGKYYYYNDEWRTYTSSSRPLNLFIDEHGTDSLKFEILAVFTSKSAIRYAEAAGIIWSRSYEDRDRGLNWSFEGCKGTLKFELTDEEQLKNLYEKTTN